MLLLAACGVPAPQPPRHHLQWQQQPGELALVRDGDLVWRFCTGDDRPKPCLHPLALPGGRVLTLDQPNDHRWHHGLWFSWKLIDGVNYWENESATGRPAGRTAWQVASIDERDDGACRIVLDLTYAPENGEVALREHRVLEMGAPADDGAFVVDWDCTFTAARACVLDRTPLPGEPGGKVFGGYAGLSLRLVNLEKRAAVTAGGPGQSGPVDWNRDDRFRARASAMEYDGVLAGQEVGVAILDHPDNLNSPSPWYAIRSKAMTFFTPAVLCYGAHAMQVGERFTLRYRVCVHPGRWDGPRLRSALAEYTGFPASRR